MTQKRLSDDQWVQSESATEADERNENNRIQEQLAYEQAVAQWRAFRRKQAAKHVPPGEYRARIASTRFLMDANGEPYLEVTFRIIEGPERGKSFPYRVYFDESHAFQTEYDLWKLGVDTDNLPEVRSLASSREIFVISMLTLADGPWWSTSGVTEFWVDKAMTDCSEEELAAYEAMIANQLDWDAIREEGAVEIWIKGALQ